MAVKHISSGSEFEDLIGYSRAVLDGQYAFVSGTTGYDYAAMTISSDVVEQAEQCMKNIEMALNEAGLSCEDIVRIRYLFPNKQDFKPCWHVFKKYLGVAKPAATMMVVQLMEQEMKLEVEVTARVKQ